MGSDGRDLSSVDTSHRVNLPSAVDGKEGLVPGGVERSLDLRGTLECESKVGRMNKGRGRSMELAFGLLLGAVSGRRHWPCARYCSTVHHTG